MDSTLIITYEDQPMIEERVFDIRFFNIPEPWKISLKLERKNGTTVFWGREFGHRTINSSTCNLTWEEPMPSCSMDRFKNYITPAWEAVCENFGATALTDDDNDLTPGETKITSWLMGPHGTSTPTGPRMHYRVERRCIPDKKYKNVMVRFSIQPPPSTGRMCIRVNNELRLEWNAATCVAIRDKNRGAVRYLGGHARRLPEDLEHMSHDEDIDLYLTPGVPFDCTKDELEELIIPACRKLKKECFGRGRPGLNQVFI